MSDIHENDSKKDSKSKKVYNPRYKHVNCNGKQRIEMAKELLHGDPNSHYLMVPRYYSCAEALLRYVLVHSDIQAGKSFDDSYEGMENARGKRVKGHKSKNIEWLFKKVQERYPDEISSELVKKVMVTKESRNLIVHEFCYVGKDNAKSVVETLGQLISALNGLIHKHFEE